MRRFHPDGGRFLVKEYPKDEEHRQVTLSPQLIKKIEAHIAEHGLGDDDLLFVLPERQDEPALRAVPDPDWLGWTEKNASGRSYRHGSLSGYSAGKCRCGHCNGAYAIYRATRRDNGKDSPRGHKVWPWVTTVVGLIVSVVGNVGHIQPLPGQPVTVADRLTAATKPGGRLRRADDRPARAEDDPGQERTPRRNDDHACWAHPCLSPAGLWSAALRSR